MRERSRFRFCQTLFSPGVQNTRFTCQDTKLRVTGQNPPGQNSPGQNPPGRNPPRTKSPQAKIPLDEIPPVNIPPSQNPSKPKSPQAKIPPSYKKSWLSLPSPVAPIQGPSSRLTHQSFFPQPPDMVPPVRSPCTVPLYGPPVRSPR